MPDKAVSRVDRVADADVRHVIRFPWHFYVGGRLPSIEEDDNKHCLGGAPDMMACRLYLPNQLVPLTCI